MTDLSSLMQLGRSMVGCSGGNPYRNVETITYIVRDRDRKDNPAEFYQSKCFTSLIFCNFEEKRVFTSYYAQEEGKFDLNLIEKGLKFFEVNLCGKELFPFSRRSFPLFCCFNIKDSSKNGKMGTNSFSSLFRVHFHMLPTRINQSNPCRNTLSLCLGEWSVWTDLINSFHLELWRRFPHGKFEITSIKNKGGEKFSPDNIFSYNFLFDLENDENVIDIDIEHKKLNREHMRIMDLKMNEKAFHHHSSVDLFQHAYSFLREFKDTADYHFNCEKILPLYYLKPQQFLKISHQLVHKIQKRITSIPHDFPVHKGIYQVLETLEKLQKTNDTSSQKFSGRLTRSFFLDFILHMTTQALIQRDFFTAFKLGLRGQTFLMAQNGKSLTIRAQFFSSMKMCNLEDPKEARKVLSKAYPGANGLEKGVKLITFCRQVIESDITKLLEAYRKFPYNVHSLRLEKRNEHSLGHLSMKKQAEILKRCVRQRLPSGKAGLEVNPAEDCMRMLSRLPFFFEVAHMYRYEKSFEDGFELIYYLMFVVVINAMSGGNPLRVDRRITPEEVAEQGTPMMFCAHHFFGLVPDPFFQKPFIRLRIYDIIFNIFLKKVQLVGRYIKKNVNKQILPPSEIFYQLSLLCWSRGKIDLADKYIQMALKEENHYKLGYSRFMLEMSLSSGRLSATQRASTARFVVSQIQQGKLVTNVTSCCILEISKIDKILASAISSENNNYLYTIEKYLQNPELQLFRVPSLFCQGLYVIIGGKVKTKKSSKSSVFLRRKSREMEKREQHIKKWKKSRKGLKRVDDKIISREADGELLDILYSLAITAFLDREFDQLLSWIIVLTDLEFYHESYESSPELHSLYQVVANVFFREISKYRASKQNFISELRNSQEASSSESVIYLVGDGQILPFAHRSVVLSNHPYKLVPIFCQGIRACHLSESSSNPRKECLLKRINKIVKSSQSLQSPVRIIFMIGELDLRSRILNGPVTEDRLHTQFSESYQIEILCDLVVRFVEKLSKDNGFSSVAICPVFPMMNVLETRRVSHERLKYGVSGCENRVWLFNRFLAGKIEDIFHSEKRAKLNRQKKWRKKQFLYSNLKLLWGLDRVILDGREEDVLPCVDLGCAAYVDPGRAKLECNLMKEFEKILMTIDFLNEHKWIRKKKRFSGVKYC